LLKRKESSFNDVKINECAAVIPQANLNQFATYSISAVILPLTSFNVTVSTPASFTLSKVTESPSSSTRLKSQVSDFALLLKRTWIFPPAASTFPSRRRFASQSLLSEAVTQRPSKLRAVWFTSLKSRSDANAFAMPRRMKRKKGNFMSEDYFFFLL